MVELSHRYHQTIALIDACNAADPNREFDALSNMLLPKEQLYAQRMSAMLERFSPEATETARIAIRSQHIQRWKIPRSDYPATPQGYKQWRTRLYSFHAETVAALMQQAGYDETAIDCVRISVGKRGIKTYAQTQLLEDVASLVFMAHYLDDFHTRHPEYNQDKWRDILHKTWKKMSPAGRRFAQTAINVPAALAPLLAEITTATEPVQANLSMRA
ncbi:MAG: DUF4202 domain-containing protein [Sterolibacterium sp.]|nr:DUF4202 domain-containing protein [Sterolibacterium sp.]